jgi:hypothetical protein
MSEIEMLHSFSDVARLIRVERRGRALANCTETAVTGANIAAKHKSCRPISPAFEDVRTPCFLTDRVQLQPFNQFQQMIVVGWIADTNPQPFRFRLTGFRVQDCKLA